MRGAAMCASSRTRCIARCSWRHGEEIGPDAIALPSAKPAGRASRPSARAPDAGLVGRTVADVERDLIIETLQHCLGNRTHAANILGISIRTLRNKLQLYRQEGVAVPLPSEPERVHGLNLACWLIGHG